MFPSMVENTFYSRSDCSATYHNAGMVTGTASIAVVATTSALLAKPLADLSVKSGET